MTVHSFSSAAGAAAPLTRARVSGSLPVWSLSLGCPKNRVDTEHLLGSLGMPVHSVEHMGRARLVFINTCGFIEPAVRESIRSILDAVERLGRCKRRPLLAVAGCMVGRYGVKDLAADLPEVDLWLPTDELENWPAMVREALGLPAAPAAPGRLLSTGPSYAWLKVGEGCRHKCAFCTIPSIRGPLRSVPAADLREEARGLLAGGVRELVLVAQDLTSWGSDFDTPQSLPHLLDELLPLDRLTWLRLLYLYPSGVTPELLRYMREAGPQLLPYFDIPLQHAHPEVLTRMGRPFANDPRRVVDRVREALLNDAVKKGGVMASSSVGGLSGAFIPVSEDEGMIAAARSGALHLDKLEAMTCVCSVGLDMIAVPGDTPAETISAIIADEAAIGMVNNKTTAVRLLPAPGKTVGDRIEMGGLLGSAPVMPVHPESSADFIARGGRIPAPLHSLKN